MPEFKEVVRKRLRVLMAEADMTPEQLSDKSGVSVDSVRQYLRGETVPHIGQGHAQYAVEQNGIVHKKRDSFLRLAGKSVSRSFINSRR